MALERINLVPQKPISEKIKRASPLILGILFVLILIFVASKNYLLSRRIIQVDSELTTIQNQIDQAAQFQVQQQILNRDILKLNEDLAKLQVELGGITAIQAEKRHFSQVLTRITQTMSPSMRCDSISFQGANGQIKGVALDYKDLPAFVDELKNDPLFKSAILKDIDRTLDQEQKRLTYSIAFELR
jgi:Tfp pilus assembly protein PilN